MDKHETQLARYDTMCAAIRDAVEVDEVKDIRDKAVALEAYSRQARNTDNERYAAEIRIRAERKAGALLKELDKPKGGQPSEKNRLPEGTGSPTLASLSITKKQSAQWQKLAEVPNQAFEDAVTDPDKMPTTAGILRLGADHQSKTKVKYPAKRSPKNDMDSDAPQDEEPIGRDRSVAHMDAAADEPDEDGDGDEPATREEHWRITLNDFANNCVEMSADFTDDIEQEEFEVPPETVTLIEDALRALTTLAHRLGIDTEAKKRVRLQ